MDFLKGKKTYIVSGLLAVVSLINMLSGKTTITDFIGSDHFTTLLGAAGLSSLRAGIK